MGRVMSLGKEQREPVRWGKPIEGVARRDRNANPNFKIQPHLTDWQRPKRLITAQVGEETTEGTSVQRVSPRTCSFLDKLVV